MILYTICILCCVILFFVLCYGGYKENFEDNLNLNHHNSIYILRTHVLDETFMQIWYKCLNELPTNALFILYDNTNASLTQEFYNKYKKHIITITQDEAVLLNKYHVSMWASLDAPLAKCAMHFQKGGITYDYIWLFENDVFCDGNLLATFNKANSLTDDFLATHIEAAKPDWQWYHHLQGSISEYTERLQCLFCITRYSSRFINLIVEELGKNSGYCELYIPTLAKSRGLTISNLPSDMVSEKIKWDLQDEIVIKYDNKLHHKYVFGKTKLVYDNF